MKERLLIDARMWRSSGIGTYSRHLIPRVAARIDGPIRLLGHPEELAGTDFPASVEIVPFTAPIYSIREQIEWLKADLRKEDLIWIPHYNVPFFTRVRFVTTVHDMAHFALPGLGPVKRLYARLFFGRVARDARRIFCISRHTLEAFKHYTGSDGHNCVLTLLGVPEISTTSAPEQTPPETYPYYLFVGNVKPHKNLSGLLNAFRLLGDRTDAHLVIVGRREGFITGDPRIEAEAAQLSDRVHFAGEVSMKTLDHYYRHARAFLMPSLYEGFGLPPLEAMARDCPVLSSHATSLPEVCGDAALYFDPFDPQDIARVISAFEEGGRALRQQLIDAGRQRLSAFSWDTCADIVAREIESAWRETR